MASTKKVITAINLDEAQQKDLRSYLIPVLEPICDADPGVLSSYIITLFKANTDKDNEDLSRTLSNDLEDFLGDRTKPFITGFINWISLNLQPDRQSDLNPPNPSPQRPPASNSSSDSNKMDQDNSRKRKLDSSSDDNSNPNSNSNSNSSHNPKRRKTSLSPSRFGEVKRHSSSRDRSPIPRRSPPSRDRSRTPERPHYRDRPRSRDRDRRYRDEDRDRDRDRDRDNRRDFNPNGRRSEGNNNNTYRRGPGRNSSPNSLSNGNINQGGNNNNNNNTLPPPPKRRLCRDFEKFGSCSRGDRCIFSHSTQDINNNGDFNNNSNGPNSNPNDPSLGNNMDNNNNNNNLGNKPMGRGRGRGKMSNNNTPGSIRKPGLNPNNLNGNRIHNNNPNNNSNPLMSPNNNNPMNNNNNIGMNGNNNNGNNNNNGKQRRNPTDTVVVTKIPPEVNNMKRINEHFSKFGTILSIQIDQSVHRAYVQFDNPSQALAAVRCPEAVLENRFIQVHMRHSDSSPNPNPNPNPNSLNPNLNPLNPIPVGESFEINPNVPIVAATGAIPVVPQVGIKPNSHTLILKPVTPIGAAPVANPQRFVGQQQQQNQQQISNLQAQIQQLEKMKHDLRNKQLEEQKALVSLLSKMKGPSAEKTELLGKLKSLTEKIDSSLKKDEQAISEAVKKLNN
eukprot:TRINITY_DN765_c0_g1_i1.p1 TRINITY_DN765_c0_g1~~TRINITY_DN765_c0_g1_i1.p1  ORF type:complete len:673 (-),score=225.83 TRINITY_DN765_c0_g1_i1:55-2073(-)